ncbi:MAG TPA: homoserine kinase [Candidatus Binatia bacterium]|nr:homoserine kinase [Candidatus Binatia bacterium]
MHWIAELDGRRLSVEVPASTANLGAGYDCLALALAIPLRVEIEILGWSRGEVELSVSGEGEGELPANRQNRIVRGLVAAIEAARGPVPERVGWRIAVQSEIPLARGLGSSAAATVAGLVAGNVLSGEGLTTADLLRLATEIEGHPDNAAAALLGGFVVVGPAPDGSGLEAIRFDAPRDLRAILFIPERRLATEEMRRVLPAAVPLTDAVANLGRVALGVAGLSVGRTELLRVLTEDRLHEPYRAAVFPELPRLTAAARAAGALGACLSGAGSTVVAFADSVASITRVEAALAAAAADLDLAGRLAVVAPRNVGATIVGRG